MGNRASDKRKRKKRADATAGMMPWSGAYREMGMLRCGKSHGKGRYSVAFRIIEASPEEVISLDPEEIRAAVSALLSGFGRTTWQVFSINRKMDEEDYRRKILLPEKGSAVLDPMIAVYNEVVSGNIPLGHNNMTREHYIVFSRTCGSPQEALRLFRMIEVRTRRFFEPLRYQAACLTLGERLSLIYSMCNSGREPFGLRCGLRAGTFDPEIMRKMNLTTRACTAPASAEDKKTCLVLGERFFSRTFFISSFPSVLSGNLISELTGISSQMVFSACCEPLETEFGFDLARDEVSGNMVLKRRRDKLTLADRRMGKVAVQQEMLEHSEDAYWAKAALDVLADAKSSGTGVFLCTFLIVLYAESLMDLEQDTRLLTLSASRFAFQIRTLDGMQKEGLCSAMPLAGTYVDVRRVLPVSRLCDLNLFDIQSVLKENGLFVGMNEINDNMILLNRRNSPLPSGLIAGIRHAGKTWQVKREIWNNMLAGKDVIVLIAGSKERGKYEPFIKSLGGAILDGARFNFMRSVEDYGVVEDGKLLKEDFFAALMAVLLNGGVYASFSDDAADEAARIASSGIADVEELEEFLYEHGDRYPLLLQAMNRVPETFLRGTKTSGRRLNYFDVQDAASMLIVLETVWNLSVANKRKNLSTWIFVDAADEILSVPQGARYMGHLMRLSNIMNNPVTLVLQNAALFAAGEKRLALNSILPQCGYFKLLSLGPVERKMFCEELGISPALVPYVTNPGVGRGLVIDQTASLPFNDHCRDVCEDGQMLAEIFEPG